MVEDRSLKKRILRDLAIIGIPLLGAAAVAVPGLLSSERASNERNAATYLKALAYAEADFRDADRDGNGVHDFWTADVAGLRFLEAGGKEIALINADLARADARPLRPLPGGPVPFKGYYFSALERDEAAPGGATEYRTDTDRTGRKVHHLTKFGFCAYPATSGAGKYAFFVNEAFTVYRKPYDGKPPSAWPSDLRPQEGGPMHKLE
jgi:hypothetical protein